MSCTSNACGGKYSKLVVHALSHEHACLYEMNLISMLDMKYDEHDDRR